MSDFQDLNSPDAIKHHKPTLTSAILSLDPPTPNALHRGNAAPQGGAGVASERRLRSHEDRDEGTGALQELGAHVLSDGSHLHWNMGGVGNCCYVHINMCIYIYIYTYVCIYI